MAKGGSGSGGGNLLGKDGNPGKVSDIKDMISQRGTKQQEVDEVLSVSRRLNNLYGDEGQITQFQTAKMTGAAAYYDSDGNIAMNERLMNGEKMDASYDKGVSKNFHPSRGDKSGIQAVAAHEYGHAMSDKVAQRLGHGDLERASKTIVERARQKTGQKTNMEFAGKISGYAQYNFAECVAEGFCDWYCNGSKAKKESRAIVAVMNSMLKRK